VGSRKPLPGLPCCCEPLGMHGKASRSKHLLVELMFCRDRGDSKASHIAFMLVRTAGTTSRQTLSEPVHGALRFCVRGSKVRPPHEIPTQTSKSSSQCSMLRCSWPRIKTLQSVTMTHACSVVPVGARKSGHRIFDVGAKRSARHGIMTKRPWKLAVMSCVCASEKEKAVLLHAILRQT